MKKIILTFVFCMAGMGASFAQNNIQAMRFLTVNALMEYGQKLYDRGDYNGACAVFKHVLAYDGSQPQALRYLKDMKRSVSSSASHALKPQVSDTNIEIQKKINISDKQELKNAIEAEKQLIKTLQDQITRMRSDIDSLSSEEKIN
ncbi:MAG: hypothetical protein HQL14_08065 [Candidatus Omnitrophica bacterium]|nr:hypothetical protein [Candidatus Omnitrophota bacterium]